MKRILILAALAPLAAQAQTVGSFQSGHQLPAADLNAALGTKLDAAGSLTAHNGIALPLGNVADRGVSRTSVLEYGAKCDGSTDDFPAFAAAIAAAGLAPAGGHVVEVPATGHSCVLKTGIVLGSGTLHGVSLEGVAGMHWPTYNDNTEADWTSAGSWIRCDDTVNACITMSGNGEHIRGLNVWYTQPTPPGTSCGATCTFTHTWTPVNYPWTIQVLAPQAFNWISDVTVVNGTNCLDIEGPASGVGTFYMHLDHVHLGCFSNVVNWKNIDNTVALHDYRDQVLWYQANPAVWGWMEGDSTVPGHKIGWNMSYVSGLQADDVEFYQDATAIQATNGNVTSGLGNVAFAVQAGQWVNFSFNQVCRAIYVDPAVNNFNARLTNIILNIDPQTSGIAGQCGQNTANAFDLQSDGVDLSLTNVDAYTSQTFAAIGGGNSGALHIAGTFRDAYSAYSPGLPGFKVNNGGALDMPHGLNGLFPGPSAGPKIQGNSNWPIVGAGDLYLSANPGEARNLYFVRNSNSGGFAARWGWVLDNTPETGSNAGSNLRLDAKSDTGANIFSPIGINRATGVVNLNNGAVVAGGLELPNGARAVLPTSCAGQVTGALFSVTQAPGTGYGLVGICP